MSLGAQLPALYPELFLAVAAMALLLYGAFAKGNPTRRITWLAVASFGVALILLLGAPVSDQALFNGMFVLDRFAVFMKALVLLGAAFALVMSIGYIRHEGMERFEFPVLIVLSTVGMLLMVSANDLMSLYLGLELQSLAAYVIASFKRDSGRSSEAGLKYFVLGALSSGMLLYGASLVYGFTGSTNFTALASALTGATPPSLGLTFGLVFVIAGMAFKASAAPFHMWTPDVYEGAPTPVTAFFAAAPKVAAIALFLRVVLGPFAELDEAWRQLVIAIALISMAIGSLAAIWQTNLKRLMAYSSIGHVGYALIGLAAGTEEGARGVLIYMATYLAMTIGSFACILAMRRREGMVEGIADLAGLARTQPAMAFALAAFMFSLAGIPPLAGFFAKFYVFLAAVNAGLYWLAVFGVVASVVGAFYYLRIVKIMYFDEPAEPFLQPRAELRAIMAVTGAFTVLFFAGAAPIVAAAGTAAKTFFP